MSQQAQTAGAADAKRFSIRNHIVFASVVMSALAFGVGVWAASVSLAGAVIAPGTFVVERNVKKVQHSYGGIVSEIAVKNGDRVEAGQLLLKLDATQIRAELGIVRSQQVELGARAARLAAERDGAAEVTFPASLDRAQKDAASAMDGEVRLFHQNRKTKDSQKAQLELRVGQLNEEIRGLEKQRDAKFGELGIIQRELREIRALQSKNLTPVSRVYAMEREEMRLSGEHGGLVSQIARAQGQISEINVQIISLDEDTRTQAQKELRAIEGRIAELAEREVAAADRLNRIDLRAPQAGIVHELAVHTIGGVVTGAEQIMVIVPNDDNLTIQARISPQDVDQVAVGRPARLLLSAFNQQQTPELEGHVATVSADVTTDPKSGANYYLATLRLDEQSQKSIGDMKLVPGMPVEVFIATGDRTALSYLAKPFTDQMNRAMRE